MPKKTSSRQNECQFYKKRIIPKINTHPPHPSLSPGAVRQINAKTNIPHRGQSQCQFYRKPKYQTHHPQKQIPVCSKDNPHPPSSQKPMIPIPHYPLIPIYPNITSSPKPIPVSRKKNTSSPAIQARTQSNTIPSSRQSA